MEGEDSVNSFGRREISAADMRFQLIVYQSRVSVFRGILKVEPGLIWSLEEVLKQVYEHIGPKIDIYMNMIVHVAQETRHVLDDPGVFFFPPSEVHAAFPIDCGLISDGLREPILIPAVSIAAGARSGQIVSGVHIGAQDGHSEG